MCIKWKKERWCTDIKLLNNCWAPLTFLQNNNGTLHKIEKFYLIVLPYCEYWPTLLFNTNEYNNKVNDKQKQKIFTSIYYYYHAKYSMENRFTMWKNMATACLHSDTKSKIYVFTSYYSIYSGVNLYTFIQFISQNAYLDSLS